MRAFLLFVFLLCMVSLICAFTAYDAYGASCHTHGAGLFTVPDNPGARSSLP
jgi:hypothetical protein